MENEIVEMEDTKQKSRYMDVFNKKMKEERQKLCDKDAERDEECGICMELCSKIVLPGCNHVMCIKCFRDCICLPRKTKVLLLAFVALNGMQWSYLLNLWKTSVITVLNWAGDGTKR